MVKKLFAVMLGLLMAGGLNAQTESTIAASDILYWVGEGTSSAIFVVDYGTGAVAWGYHFDATAGETVEDMATAISDSDPRFYYGWGMLAYTAYPVSYDPGYGAFFFKVDGVQADDYDEFSDYDLEDGMLVKVSSNTTAVWSAPITPASVMYKPVDATIAASDILYWVGEGTDSLVFAVNWGEPDVALAWGLKFSGELTIDGALRAVCAADSRLSADNPLTSINYNDGTLSLAFHPSTSPINVPQFILNGNGNVNAGTTVANGDFLKIGESLYGYGFDSVMGYAMGVVWPTEITPVSDPNAPVDPQPVEATIAASDIVYWVGTGANVVVMAVNWADTALAWGYRFDGEKTVNDMMDDIAEADPRFSYTMDGGYLGDILFVVAEGDTLRKQAYSYWESKQNGVSDAGMGQALTNGAFEKWAEPAAGVVVDSFSYEWEGTTYWSYIYVYPMEISPVSDPNPAPQPVEATIAAGDILYWVGTGANEVVMAVNWADTALAWGYRFDGEKTVSDMMDDIADADPRFSYTMDGGYLGDILFVVAEGDTLRKQAYSYWESKQNGVSDAGMSQALADGAFEKWAEPAAGVVVDSMEYEGYWYYTYVYTMEISPVSVPQTTGIDGVEGATVSVYPNPVADVLTVSGVNGRAVLFDMRGSVVASFDVDGAETRVSLGSLANGVYMLRVADGVAKIVVRH